MTTAHLPLLFLSHAWRADAAGRDTHARVRRLAVSLRRRGWDVWLDEERIGVGDVDGAMADGIDASAAVLVCVTRAYLAKIDLAARDPTARDRNCYKEWTYATGRGKLRIPVVCDADCLRDWPPASILSMHLGSSLYVDATDDAALDDGTVADRLTRLLRPAALVSPPPRRARRTLLAPHLLTVDAYL